MDFLDIPKEKLGTGSNIRAVEVANEGRLYFQMARDMYSVIRENNLAGKRTLMIVPLGPVGQYYYLSEMINLTGLSLRDTVFINMDEYLGADGAWLSAENGLSFRGQMDRLFYSLVDGGLNVLPENRIFPDPAHPGRIGEIIGEFGGVDACFGGIGINGHVAFNEPQEELTAEAFADLPTRVVSLARETLAVNSIPINGGYMDGVPKQAVTVGMKDILSAKKIRLYAMRDWHGGAIRAILHGPVTASVPASLLQRHGDCVLYYTANTVEKK